MISTQGLWRLARCLLVGVQSRGKDASGFAYVKSNGNTNFAKAAVQASDFVKIPGHLLAAQPEQMPQNLLLHARYATKGEPSNNQNNHPLYSKMSGLCMIHNGWFVNDGEVKEQFSLKPDAEVDTEVYLRLIEKFYIEGDVKTIETAIKEATKCVYGAIACAMVQGGKPGVMWLWRDRGDLVVIHTEFGYVFASTVGILASALGCLNSLDLVQWKPFLVPPATLVKFELGVKPKMFKLDSIDWSQRRDEIYTTTINGEEKLRRQKKGGTTYYYGNGTPFCNSNFNSGYYSNKGYHYVSGQVGNESGSTNNRTAEAANQTSDEKVTKRPEGHHFQCKCKPCTEWWDWQIEHDSYCG